MTAFEQAWGLLKSIDAMKDPNNAAMKNNPDYYYNNDFQKWMYSPLETRDDDEDYWHHRIQTDYAPKNDMSLAEIEEEVSFNPADWTNALTQSELAEIAEKVGFGPAESPFNESKNNNQIFATRPKIHRDRTFQSRLPIDNLMTHDTPDSSPIIDGRYKLPLMHQSLAPITPLEERLPKKPIPSHIEYNPNYGSTGRFELIGNEGQKLSSIVPDKKLSNELPLSEQFIGVGYGNTPVNFRRQDFYKKLMRGLLNAGLGIKSDSRNSMSHPFHENLIDTMSPNIKVRMPRGNLSPFSPITYRRKNRPNVTMEKLKQMQEGIPGLMSNDPNELEIAASGLNAADYGSLPIRITQPKPQPTNVPASKVGVITPAGDTSSQTSLEEYSPRNFRGIDAIRERHRIQNVFDGDGY